MVKLAPSILSADFARLLEDVKKVEKAGCEYLHIDVMDGHFVPNITLGPGIVKSLRKDVNMVFDAHLMIENPDNYIEEFVKAGCDIITVHVEACTHLHRTIQNIKSHGIKAGVVLNPATSLDTIKYVLDDVDMVLLMSVNPGFAGQKYLDFVTPKFKKFVDESNNYGGYDVMIDGACSPEKIHDLSKIGVKGFILGTSALFNKGRPYSEIIPELRKV